MCKAISKDIELANEIMDKLRAEGRSAVCDHDDEPMVAKDARGGIGFSTTHDYCWFQFIPWDLTNCALTRIKPEAIPMLEKILESLK